MKPVSKHNNKLFARSAFTLAELLIVLAIVGVLMVAVSLISSGRN